ncbi:MAG: hypothetical protein IM584_06185 [Chitinophagaceae bacterium]|nr:hypothetical protein [Chitinophagaceae bacterium]MCA6454197.1 hypothetical protein [Chitinophagaceae bacterium]MCA6455707.1 hypothetical protein [Chitinophagaceae bacterium]MCA6459507.1 hypothetical protein [Chitinophagaceae bacterium]MCA6464689.1 hypothetical protein [Chitinophagaceae bacterium]
MKFLMISCKKATWLVSKKEEKRLSWHEKWQLRAHMALCSMCRRFEEQSGFIARMARQIHVHETLSDTSKEKMQQALVREH